MKSEKSSSSDYVVYLRHSSSASASVPMTSAAPDSLAALMRNRVVVVDTFVAPPSPQPVPPILPNKNHTQVPPDR